MKLVAISAESAEDSKIMKDRKKAPFLFIADQSMKLIDAYDFRYKNIAQPGFVLLHHGHVVWKKREMKFLRQNTSTILQHVKAAQLSTISNISIEKMSADE